jgi:putative drug exporter of the RND superfamily
VHADDIFRAIGRFSVKFRWVIVLAWLVAAVAISIGLPSLASVTQGNNSQFLPASAPSQQAANLAAPFGGSNLIPVPVVAAVSTGTLTAADQAYLTTLSADLGKVPTVVKVNDLGVSATRAGVSGQAAQIQVLSNVSQNNQAAQTDLINNLRNIIKATPPPPGMQAHLAGALAIQVDQQKQSGNTGNQVEGVAFVFILILLFLIFRSVVAPFVAVIPAVLTVSIAGPVVAELANHGLKVSSLAQLLLTVLVLGAGTDYALFLVFRVREHLREGEAPREAVVNALTKVGESITFSALTVIAALLSLLAATFQIYSDLGIPLAIGIAVMLLGGLTLVPAFLAILGRWAFFPSRTFWLTPKMQLGPVLQFVVDYILKPIRWALNMVTFGGLMKLWLSRGERARRPRPASTERFSWGRIATSVVKRPGTSLLIGVIVFGALSVAVTGYQSAGFGGTISAPAGTDSAAGQALLAKYFPASSANPTNLVYKLSTPVWEDPTVIATATTQLQHSPLFTGVTGPLNPVGGAGFTPAEYTALHAALGSGTLPATVPPIPAAFAGKVTPTQWAGAYQEYRATAQFVDAQGTTIQFQTGLTAGDPSSTAALNAVPALRAEAATVGTTMHATAYGVGGEAPAFYDISQISNTDLLHVIPIAIVVIGVLLALVMRSLVAPLYLIASVALSYFAALGFAVIVFIELGHSGGITFILPFLLFIFLLALGEDYNILVMTRIREEAHRMPLREAVAKAIGVTGTTVTSAGLVLAGTFAVFAVVGGSGSGGSQIRDVGIGLAVGVIMDTFVVRTVLVPCTAVLLGRWNWWPSKIVVDSPEADAVSANADALGLTTPGKDVRSADSGTDASGASDSPTDSGSPRHS